MPSCCVVGCHNWTGHPPETSFHRFPKDDAVANKWTLAIKGDNLPEKYRETSFVCSQHFRRGLYERPAEPAPWHAVQEDIAGGCGAFDFPAQLGIFKSEAEAE